MIVSVSDDAIVTLLRSFLLAVLPAGVEVVQGQTNRVAEPGSDDFVVFSPLGRRRLATDEVTPATSGTQLDQAQYKARTEATYQLDVHGDLGADNSQIIFTMFRSAYACEFFGANIQPLYTSEPRQASFVNAENQYEDRWVIEVSLQVNPIVTAPQQYADVLGPIITKVADR